MKLLKNSLRKVLFVLICCLLSVINLEAQDRSNFFPHHLGDVWEYGYFDGVILDRLQVIVVFDSTDLAGNSYIKHDRQFVSTPHQPLAWADSFRVDSLQRVFSFYGPSVRLVYKLNASLNELWIVQDFGAGYHIARVEDIYPDTLFGIPTTVKGIAYYGAQDTSDTTTWLLQYGELLADGFGIIYRGGGDLGHEINLRGAVIDGVLYGDTTFVGINDKPTDKSVPHRVQLFQNYPNPFNPSTTIRFELPHAARVRLEIVDIAGRRVAALVNERREAGMYTVRWNARDFASGIYFYRLQTNGFVETRKMLLIE